jgi:uncharacterized protein involved in copper resistance
MRVHLSTILITFSAPRVEADSIARSSVARRDVSHRVSHRVTTLRKLNVAPTTAHCTKSTAYDSSTWLACSVQKSTRLAPRALGKLRQ